ncbi:hypothetical protein QJS10_CPA07g00533 [Acorus calamus]|uniref:RNase H type-1 domain-containing protein n=1 Tax=Acorus calamus TaxID=4465 RepID=A0AAV9EFR8_ACOCL|nr:hypothetical protein QJS10_CPA07g00533 [Acorus calamus]
MDDPWLTAGRALSIVDECCKLIAQIKPPQPIHFQEVRAYQQTEHAYGLIHSDGGNHITYVITDGSVDGNTRAAGAGFVVVQNQPFSIVGAGYLSWLWASPLRAEGEAIRQGVLFARQRVTDAEVWVRLLHQDGPGPPQFQDLVQDIKNVSRSGDIICAIKVGREHVKAPEVLAKYARRTQNSKTSERLADDHIRGCIYKMMDSVHECIKFVKVAAKNSMQLMSGRRIAAGGLEI